MPTTLRADIPVAINYWSGQGSFSEIPKLSTVTVDIPVDYGSKSYKILSTIAFRATKS